MIEVSLLSKTYPYEANTYIVCSDQEYLVVDPAAPPPLGIRPPKYIILTHSHFDHILSIDKWSDLGGEVYICEDEILGPQDSIFNCFRAFLNLDKGYNGNISGLKDGQILNLGNDIITLIKTPGHTKGSSIYRMDKIAFVGDTVFAGGGYGRWDLPSGNFLDLKNSIEKVLSLPDDTILYPGHGEKTTVKEYKNDYIRI